jgi:hypothetical protein
MRILAIILGEYGQRHVDNLRAHGPTGWRIEVWQAPTALPPIVDYPEDFLPDDLPPADLILSFAEHKGVAELLPEIARMTGAQAVIAPVDSEAWLPRGLARQLCGWLADVHHPADNGHPRDRGVACVTPKPLCSLTETHYGVGRRQQIEYDNALIAEFARHFGRPELRIGVDPQTRTIVSADVVRDAVCGCARHVAQGLIGVSVDDAEQQAGLLHHHYPCLASMGIDTAFGDTLMHVSGNLLKENVAAQVKPFKQVRYYVPGERGEL